MKTLVVSLLPNPVVCGTLAIMNKAIDFQNAAVLENLGLGHAATVIVHAASPALDKDMGLDLDPMVDRCEG